MGRKKGNGTGARLSLMSLYPGFAGLVLSGRAAVFPECVHKPWQFGSTVFQTAMVCEVTQTMAVWKTVQCSPLIRATDIRSTRLYGQFLASPDRI